MYFMKLIFKSFLMPPGIFIVLIVGYGSWCLARRHYPSGLSLLVFGILAWGLSTVPVADTLLRPLEKGMAIPADPMGDVIIVLGAGTNGERPDPLGKGGPSERTLTRLVVGARLHRNLGLPVLASGRGNGRDPEATVLVTKRYLIDMGVPANQVIVETKSRDTKENAAFSAEICRAKAFKRPILVTSAYHLKRAKRCFDAEGLKVLAFPSSFETWQGKRYPWTAYLPGNYRRSSTALHEYLALLQYRLFPYTTNH